MVEITGQTAGIHPYIECGEKQHVVCVMQAWRMSWRNILPCV
ncbi:hypothetical protein BRYFOR_08048 [Marvinbryantia formatexigens DSM 14469]|uniref:Uncharacterized protein n=1 Tax=Marvinbryantia formatexigens DSM 14469 TaxID=478749 RepID=C6LHD7_9FIRM|nr:hypothetical protein [Marvinbryantia formatexigens]EET59924.1 hypothetical protein BRYFOR_08048 [Marvinbryantia formatexigens DSM 14469]